MFSKKTFKRRLKAFLPEFVVDLLRYFNLERGSGYSQRSYSQEAEDLILMALFDDLHEGFYVDVGAHHPKRFSNTNIFYQAGWTGINIEPNPEAYRKFRTHRKRDINLCQGVGSADAELDYFILNEPAMNSFDRELTEERVERLGYTLLQTRKVQVKPLKSILEKWAGGKRIDFLNVDAEGFDLDVLRSNDWDRFRPCVVLVELIEPEIENITKDAIYGFLASLGYRLAAKTTRTGIFIDTREEAVDDPPVRRLRKNLDWKRPGRGGLE